jgi:uncharacterized protein with von Willebrand factor type A (vWA) domain
MSDASLATDRVKNNLSYFINELRAGGYAINASNIQTANAILCTPVIEDRHTLRCALRSVFAQNHAQWESFNNLFEQHWLLTDTDTEDATQTNDNASAQNTGLTSGLGYFSETQAQRAATTSSIDTDAETAGGGASDARVLSQRDFRFVFNAQDMRQIEAAVDVLANKLQKRTRRRTRHSSRKGRLDLRRTTRQNLKYGGWSFDLRYRRARQSPARFLLLLDVSQSMEVYSYLFLRFARGLAQAFRDTDAYAFHTDLIPIGAEMKEKNSARLEQKLKNLSSGWLGGTRIASSLGEFNERFGKSSVNRHTIVLIFSDGYDSTEPEHLFNEVMSLKRRCRKLVWVNPLLGRDGESDLSLPIERGMKLVRPLLDHYVSAHNLESLSELAPVFSYRRNEKAR